MRAPTIILIAALAAAAGCPGSGTTFEGEGNTGGETVVEVEREGTRQSPPESGTPRDVRFPSIARASTENGLEVNTVGWDQLPIVYLRLIIKSGAEADPQDMPGLSHLVGQMLKEGTRSRSSVQLAEEVEYLGADIWVGSDEENVYIGMRALSEHLPQAMEILADVAMNPAFRPDELRKLKRREIDRLALQSNDPNFLASRTFHEALYGEHPYARIDTTQQVVERVSRANLSRWHRTHFVPNNAVLVAAGAVSAEDVQRVAGEKFASWRTGEVPEVQYATAPPRDGRQVIVVDRPESVQSVIVIGNQGIRRSDEDYVRFKVINQVLGGSAASRLFMDLREQRSLTYGAYSGFSDSVDVGYFRARAAVRNEVTGEALDAFFEHLNRIRGEAPPPEELENAQRYLSDRFPLQIDTPGKIASLVGDLRVYGLADDYWDQYRSSIRQVSAAHALGAAEEHVTPDDALIVVVGRASEILETCRRWGPVIVTNTDGDVTQRLDAATQ